MKVLDITREILSTPPYPQDPSPELIRLVSMEQGADYNLSQIHMSLHGGTHVDAPLHYISGGEDVASLAPERFLGECLVAEAEAILELPQELPPRLLLRGKPDLTGERLDKILSLKLTLLGTDQNSVGTPADEGTPHRALLGHGILLLENLDLTGVPTGRYWLLAAPIRLAGAEAAPCRVFLLDGVRPA